MRKLAVLFLLGLSLRADSIYSLSGTFADGTQLSGSFTYGAFLNSSHDGYFLNGDAHVGANTFVNGSQIDCTNTPPDASLCVSGLIFADAPDNLMLYLQFPVGNTNLCSETMNCFDYNPQAHKKAIGWQSEVYSILGGPQNGGYRIPLVSGMIIDPPASLPEPASWLLAASALAALWEIRRRSVKY